VYKDNIEVLWECRVHLIHSELQRCCEG